MEKTLHLNLKKKWFDMILSGEKKEEYREIKEHWVCNLIKTDHKLVIDKAGNFYKKTKSCYNYCVGLCGSRVGAAKYMLGVNSSFKEFTSITFSNGYNPDSPRFVIECLGIETGPAKPEWSDNWPGEVFIIKLGKIISKPEMEITAGGAIHGE